jgi:hypothetical protein
MLQGDGVRVKRRVDGHWDVDHTFVDGAPMRGSWITHAPLIVELWGDRLQAAEQTMQAPVQMTLWDEPDDPDEEEPDD